VMGNAENSNIFNFAILLKSRKFDAAVSCNSLSLVSKCTIGRESYVSSSYKCCNAAIRNALLSLLQHFIAKYTLRTGLGQISVLSGFQFPCRLLAKLISVFVNTK